MYEKSESTTNPSEFNPLLRTQNSEIFISNSPTLNKSIDEFKNKRMTSEPFKMKRVIFNGKGVEETVVKQTVIAEKNHSNKAMESDSHHSHDC